MKNLQERAWSGAAVLAALLVSGSASAQIVQAPGAPLAGLCVYSESSLLGQSAAGVAANRQLAQIQQSVNGELVTLRDKLVADDRALTAQKAQLPAADFNQRTAALQARARDLDALARTRDNQLARTRDDAVSQISRAALPLFNASLTAHGCAIVFDRTPVYSVNPVMDLTGDVIQRLNSVMTSITLQLAAPQAPAAR
jgi:outer membrane protein